MVGRFAPSPTGRMHLGNIWSALLNWLAIRQAGGRLLLRIEDIDAGRCRERHVDQLQRDLRMLGLCWDEDDTTPVLRQQHRLSLYRDLLAQWRDAGLAYPCRCTRRELHAASAPHPEDGHVRYDGRCRAGAADPARQKREPAYRLRVPDEASAWDHFTDILQGEQRMNLDLEWGDFILARADGQFAYQFVCAVDDALSGVDYVLRGADLLPSSFPQRYIHRLIGKEPPTYAHIPVLCDQGGIRLSKRQQATDLGALLDAGLSAGDILGRLAHLAGWLPEPEPISAAALLPVFRLDTLAGCRTMTIRMSDFHA